MMIPLDSQYLAGRNVYIRDLINLERNAQIRDLIDFDDTKALNPLNKGLLVQGGAMKAPKRRRSILDYRIQQLSKGSSEGSGIILEVPEELKDNSGSSSSSLFRFDDEVQDVSSDEEN
ncbi:hypothetical protein Tco_0898060 [Tanacetum coccineum]